jgi:hypothetical protein
MQGNTEKEWNAKNDFRDLPIMFMCRVNIHLFANLSMIETSKLQTLFNKPNPQPGALYMENKKIALSYKARAIFSGQWLLT